MLRKGADAQKRKPHFESHCSSSSPSSASSHTRHTVQVLHILTRLADSTLIVQIQILTSQSSPAETDWNLEILITFKAHIIIALLYIYVVLANPGSDKLNH